MQLSIIIVNYNVKYYLEHCLCSVQKATGAIKAEIIVVDNASSDGSMEYLLGKFPEVLFIDNPKNTGFARANNQALHHATGKYILFLNPDTIIPEDCFEHCLSLMESNSQLGACGVKMIDGSGRFLPESKRAFPSPKTAFYKLSGLTGLFPHSKRFARYQLGHLSENESSEIDVVSGAFFLTSKTVLQQTGSFDERFFMYGEDIDLSYRIQQAGYKNFYLAETCIIHFKGESTRKGSLNYVRLFYKAMSLFVEKHFNKKAKGLNLLLEASIWFRAGLSATKNIFYSDKRSTKPGVVNTLIVGTEQENSEVIAILHKQQSRNHVPLSPAENWKKLLISQGIQQIIFAVGALSYKEIISRIHEVPSGVEVGIYTQGSQSIIGSSFKNSNGNLPV